MNQAQVSDRVATNLGRVASRRADRIQDIGAALLNACCRDNSGGAREQTCHQIHAYQELAQ